MQRFFNDSDKKLVNLIGKQSFLENIDPFDLKLNKSICTYTVHEPTFEYRFLHESAIIEYKGVLFASWYNNANTEMDGRSPIRGRRSYDGGKTWTDVEVIADDPTAKIWYCPPVYGICDGKLYMLINEMVGTDLIHALDLFVLDEKSDKFIKLWSKPIPFKLNTNVYTLPNGKLMLPGRIAEMDGFPNTPAVLISDSGKIDAEWRLVKIAENGTLPNGQELLHPECSAIINENAVYIFCRNDYSCVPLVYVSKDACETWTLRAHDIPFSGSKIYSGTLSNGRNYLIGNILPDRKKLAIFFSKKGKMKFDKGFLLADNKSFKDYNGMQWSYPVAHEYLGKLYVIYSGTIDLYGQECRSAILSVISLNNV
jgi:hypothetical protein